MAQDMNGAGMLGAALGGAPLLRREAYNQRMNELSMAFARAATGQNQMEGARVKQARLDALGGLQAKFEATGMSPAQAALAAAAAASATTSSPEQITGAGMRERAMQDYQSGDTQRANFDLAASSGKPLDFTKISGNTAFDPNMMPGQSGMTTTDVGQAIINARNAAATNSMAQAARARAGIGADKAGNYDVTQDAQGNIIRINKLTGQMVPVTGPNGAVRGKTAAGKSLDSAKLKLLGDVFANAANGAPPAGVPGTITPKGVQDMGLNDAGYSMADLASRVPVGPAPAPQNGQIPLLGITRDDSGKLVAPTPGVPWHPTSGPAGAPAAPAIPPGVQFQFSPGTPPAVIAAARAAAANLPGGSPVAAPAPAPQSPYKEGTMLRGRDGHLYQVRGGVPVPMQ